MRPTDRDLRSRPGYAAHIIKLLMACAVCCATTPALADGDPATDSVPRMLPYQGQLEVDGRPLNATGAQALHIEFALYDGAEAEAPRYRQTQIVEVYAGRFTTTIGPVGLDAEGGEIPITRLISAADDLYLGMTLLGDPEDPADDIALSNRQRIMATPYAMWTTSATNLSVASDLIVGGDLTVGGAVRLPAGALTGRELADGSVTLADLRGDTVGSGLRAEGAAITVDQSFLNAQIRSWVRSHCRVQLGWRDECTNCDRAPSKHVTVQANGQCVDASGNDTRCRDNNRWGGLNTDGDVNRDDVFYVRLECD